MTITPGQPDPAVQVVVAACSNRLSVAITEAINAERDRLYDEGHDVRLVAVACCSAAATLAANTLIAQTTLCTRRAVFDDAVTRMGQAIDHSLGLAPFPGQRLQ